MDGVFAATAMGGIITLLYFWLLTAVVTLVAAEARGRQGFLWFLLTLPLGLFALLLVLVLPRRPRAGWLGEPIERHCPSCGTIVPITARKCSGCGDDLPAAASSLMPAGVRCSACGQERPRDKMACPHCFAPA